MGLQKQNPMGKPVASISVFQSFWHHPVKSASPCSSTIIFNPQLLNDASARGAVLLEAMLFCFMLRSCTGASRSCSPSVGHFGKAWKWVCAIQIQFQAFGAYSQRPLSEFKTELRRSLPCSAHKTVRIYIAIQHKH